MKHKIENVIDTVRNEDGSYGVQNKVVFTKGFNKLRHSDYRLESYKFPKLEKGGKLFHVVA